MLLMLVRLAWTAPARLFLVPPPAPSSPLPMELAMVGTLLPLLRSATQLAVMPVALLVLQPLATALFVLAVALEAAVPLTFAEKLWKGFWLLRVLRLPRGVSNVLSTLMAEGS